MSNTLKTTFNKVKDPLKWIGLGVMGTAALSGCSEEAPEPYSPSTAIYEEYNGQDNRYDDEFIFPEADVNNQGQNNEISDNQDQNNNQNATAENPLGDWERAGEARQIELFQEITQMLIDQGWTPVQGSRIFSESENRLLTQVTSRAYQWGVY